MYQQFHGLSEKPFDVTPDPRFLYLSAHHQEALSSIIYGIRARRGFIALIGEVGTGKTTLLNATMEGLDDKTQAAFIFNTDVGFEELLQMVLVEFDLGAPDEAIPKHVALDRLNRFATEQFAAGGNVVIFIDEAQNLDTRAMENLRLLSNLETRRYKLIQIVLSGQPELDEKLRRQELRQLAQRINLRRYITPLNEIDTYQYIAQHLEKAGARNKNLFDRTSLKRIWEYSGGVPRKINLLCDNALLTAYGLGKKKINGAIMDEAIRDLNWSPYDPYCLPVYENRGTPVRFPRPRFATMAAILLISLLLGAGSFGLINMESAEMKNLADVARIHVMEFFGYPTPRPESPEPRNVTTPSEADHSPAGMGMFDIRPVPDLPEPAEIRIGQPDSLSKPLKKELIVRNPDNTILDKPLVKEPEVLQTREDISPRPINPGSGMASADRIGEKTDGYEIKDKSEETYTAFKQVVVMKNDYLAGLVQKIYGKTTGENMQRVLRANPDIQNPNLILPGQVIRMPIY